MRETTDTVTDTDAAAHPVVLRQGRLVLFRGATVWCNIDRVQSVTENGEIHMPGSPPIPTDVSPTHLIEAIELCRQSCASERADHSARDMVAAVSQHFKSVAEDLVQSLRLTGDGESVPDLAGYSVEDLGAVLEGIDSRRSLIVAEIDRRKAATLLDAD